MRVVFVSDHFSTPDEPGILRTYRLAHHLCESGDQVTVIAPSQHYVFGRRNDNDNAYEKLPANLTLLRMRTRYFSRETGWSRLRHYADQLVQATLLAWRSGFCDVIVVGLTPSMLGIGPYVVARLRRIPFVIDERDLSLLAARELGMLPRPILRTAELVERYLHLNADATITVHPGLYQTLLQRGVDRTKLFLVPNGYDAPRRLSVMADRRALREELGWNQRFIVLYAGGLGQSYDLDPVLDSFASLPRQHFMLVIIGEGEKKGHYVARTEAEGIPAQFLATVPKSEVHAICAAADVGVLPLYNIARSRLCVPNKLLDYMGAARPVILNGPGDAADLVRAAGAGIIVPWDKPERWADALNELASNPARSEALGKAGQSYVQRYFTRERFLPDFRAALVHAVGGAVNPSPGDEVQRIRELYRAYDRSPREQRKRDVSNPGTYKMMALRRAALARKLVGANLPSDARILDVGCGAGNDLVWLSQTLASRDVEVHGVDLLHDRVKLAAETVAAGMFVVANGMALPYRDASFDLVLLSTVLSSILDDSVAKRFTSEVSRVLRPRGVILSYDVRYPNVANRNTRAVPASRLAKLFPETTHSLEPITLVPPLARRLGRLTPFLYEPLHALRFLRSHYLAEIRRPTTVTDAKPSDGSVVDLGSVGRENDQLGDQRWDRA